MAEYFNFYKLPYKFAACFLIAFIGITLLRFITTASVVEYSMFHAYTILASAVFALTLSLWNFQKRVLFLCLGYYGLYILVLLCKISSQSTVSEREILQTMDICTIFCAYGFVFYYLAGAIKSKLPSLIVKILSIVCCLCGLLPAGIYVGYYILSGGNLLLTDTIIAIMQTHFSEAKDFVMEQNLYLWALGFAFVLLYIGTFLFFFLNTQKNANRTKSLIFLAAAAVYATISVLPKYQMNFLFGTISSVKESLESFRLYRLKSADRQQRLLNIRQTISSDNPDGLFIVVIGESATRDHMSAFGYKSLTTPWLDEMAKTKNTVIFPHAYSNHVQTVQALQQVLTSQNQYNNIKLEDAYSLPELAQAAGYDTYWISNQVRFTSSDMPIETIAQGATHTKYINEHMGSKTATTYYDEKLADFPAKIDNIKKGVVFFHLMGSHAVYHDRFPTKFDVLKNNNSRIQSYDNSLLYTDHVLEKLYEKAIQNPNFSAFIYFSDHGEDIENGLAHDNSRFTFQMSRIPFFAVFSDKFIKEHRPMFKTIRKHRNLYWTSDMFYEFFVSVTNIKNAFFYDAKYDISSPEYDMPIEKLRISYGEHKVTDDPNNLF